MQEQQLFEYAIIRVVPRVEREEFINVGVILYCASQKFLRATFVLNHERLRAISNTIDIDEISMYLGAMERICNGSMQDGPISYLPVAERFRWVTATRSTVLQTSRVHPGLCKNPAEMLLQLQDQYVL